ncbi:MAG: aspartate/glutamate racemase family protein [Terriglobales bacterium]
MKSETAIKKIGIVGGVAWPSTVVYYSELSRRADELRSARPDARALAMEMTIESLDLSRAISFWGNDDDDSSWARFDDYHRDALKRLEACGAEVAVMASNTPHHRFEEIVRGIGIPVISIVDASARAAAQMGAHEVLILGTPVTMRSAKFREGFARHGIEARGPRDEHARVATEELIRELQAGQTAGAAERLGKVARESFAAEFSGRPVVCLACTELPLAFVDEKVVAAFEDGGVSYINTSGAHIDAVFEFAARGCLLESCFL